VPTPGLNLTRHQLDTVHIHPDSISRTLTKAALPAKMRIAGDRLVQPAERLVDAADEDFAEPCGERRARQVNESPTRMRPTSASASTVSGRRRSAAAGKGASARSSYGLLSCRPHSS
jgi:hypothetical protein